MAEKKRRRKYTKEFKLEALQLRATCDGSEQADVDVGSSARATGIP